MIDHKAILDKALEELTLTAQEQEDIEATFQRFVDLTRYALRGQDVEHDIKHLRAQLKLWKSGALSATQAALWNAVYAYAKEAGKVFLKVAEGALRGLV